MKDLFGIIWMVEILIPSFSVITVIFTIGRYLKKKFAFQFDIITARIRRMGEGTVFSLFVSSHLDGVGVPESGLDGWGGSTPARSGWWGVPRPGLDGGGYPSQVWMIGGNPSQVWMVGGTQDTPSQVWMVGGVPQPGLDGGGYPSQVWMVGGTWGTPQPGLDGGGYPGQVLMGEYPGQVWMVGGVPGVSPQPGLDRGVPWVPPHHDWMGYPSPWVDGVPPTMSGWGTPRHEWMGYPPTIASTGYAAGGMPLTFTQEDFLVFI